jgi:ABC-type nickel/cobalt efflux system permease component RcnA
MKALVLAFGLAGSAIVVAFGTAGCASDHREPVARKPDPPAHPAHAHPHLHPHPWGGHHHHPHPHPHLEGPEGHHHPF